MCTTYCMMYHDFLKTVLVSVLLHTHHVNDLLQSEAELELERLRLVEDGSLQVVVLGHQVVDEAALVWTGPDA